jgi:NPCBM/NEW2 domain/PA14 domain/Glycosyl hydrolases family 39
MNSINLGSGLLNQQSGGLDASIRSPLSQFASTLNITSTNPASSNGLKAEYFNSTTLSGTPALTRIDQQVNFNWGLNSPAAGVNADQFSVRWSGVINIATAGSYTFYTNSDDGVRLSIAGKKIIEDWNQFALKENRGTIDLQAGSHEIVVEYFDNRRNAAMHLSWSSPTLARQIIPTTVLFTAPPVNEKVVYLSDLQTVSARNGYGVFERDRSNGENQPNDGRTITLNGKTYSKGLGVHSDSELVYRLDGQYNEFRADIGIDDEVGSYGAVVFQIFADGQKLFDSGLMKGDSATQQVRVNLAGRKELRLVVTQGDDTMFCDHADWANALLVSNGVTPPPVLPPAPPAVDGVFMNGYTSWKNPGFNLGVDSQVGTINGANTVWRTPPANQPEDDRTGIKRNSFGFNVHNLVSNFPTVPFGTFRLWDTGTAWADLEPQQDQYQFGRLDELVNKALQNNLEISLVLGSTPRWAAADPNAYSPYAPGRSSPPRSLADWEDYVRTVTTRYKGRIKSYEIWNEPTSTWFWSGSPQELVNVARVAYNTIKAVDPSAIVTSPSEAGTKDQYRDYIAWYDEYLGAGGKNFADVINFHHYQYGKPEASYDSLVQQARNLMQKHGIANKPLWMTEGGWGVGSTVRDDGDTTISTAYVARQYLSNVLNGIDQFHWYAWDNRVAISTHMTQSDGRTPTVLASAYGQVVQWLEGSQVIRFGSLENGTNVINLRRNGEDAYVIWNQNDQSYSLELPTDWKVSKVVNLNGSMNDVVKGRAAIGKTPRLFF